MSMVPEIVVAIGRRSGLEIVMRVVVKRGKRLLRR
jgi:hypothetical protein